VTICAGPTPVPQSVTGNREDFRPLSLDR